MQAPLRVHINGAANATGRIAYQFADVAFRTNLHAAGGERVRNECGEHSRLRTGRIAMTLDKWVQNRGWTASEWPRAEGGWGWKPVQTECITAILEPVCVGRGRQRRARIAPRASALQPFRSRQTRYPQAPPSQGVGKVEF